MTPLEKDIERHLVRVVGRQGGLCLKWVCPGWGGVPDRIVLLPGGRIVFVELKRPVGWDIAPRQEWWAEKLRALGFAHVWVKSHEDVKSFERALLRWHGGLHPQTVAVEDLAPHVEAPDENL